MATPPTVPAGIGLLAVAKTSPLLAPQLDAAFTVHNRLQELDPAALAAAAPGLRALAARRGDLHFVTIQCQQERQALPGVLVVLDHQDRQA